MKFMLDTNVFNRIIDEGLDPRAVLPHDCRLVGTHVQRDELEATPDATRRADLLQMFDEFVDEGVPTESAVWGVSRWDQAKWGSGMRERLHTALDELRRKRNNLQDSLIAETAIVRGCVLVSTDLNLVKVTREFGGQAYNPDVGDGT
jgi:predicted nucleic acid-binding protein